MPSSKKIHIVKAETEDGEVDRRRMVLGFVWRQSGRAYKINPVGGGSDEDPPTFKSDFRK